ncbi:hypothetical protein KM043_010809 [Ampulex compressa]|nr:hypothetical protein KM043_010809 [Ampulex compressa]
MGRFGGKAFETKEKRGTVVAREKRASQGPGINGQCRFVPKHGVYRNRLWLRLALDKRRAKGQERRRPGPLVVNERTPRFRGHFRSRGGTTKEFAPREASEKIRENSRSQTESPWKPGSSLNLGKEPAFVDTRPCVTLRHQSDPLLYSTFAVRIGTSPC